MASTFTAQARARILANRALQARNAQSLLRWAPGSALKVFCPACPGSATVDPASPSHSIVTTRRIDDVNTLGGGPAPSIAPGIVCSSCGDGYAFVNGRSVALNGRPALPVLPPAPSPPQTPIAEVHNDPVASSASEESISEGSSKPDFEALTWTQLRALAKKLGVPVNGRDREDITADLEALY